MPKGTVKVISYRDRLTRGMRDNIVKILNSYKPIVEKEAKKMLNKSGTGVIYNIRGKQHRASAPGYPPAPDTRNLQRGVRATVDKRRLALNLWNTYKYGMILEKGTLKIRPRPWAMPTMVKIKPKLKTKLKRDLWMGLT